MLPPKHAELGVSGGTGTGAQRGQESRAGGGYGKEQHAGKRRAGGRSALRSVGHRGRRIGYKTVGEEVVGWGSRRGTCKEYQQGRGQEGGTRRALASGALLSPSVLHVGRPRQQRKLRPLQLPTRRERRQWCACLSGVEAPEEQIEENYDVSHQSKTAGPRTRAPAQVVCVLQVGAGLEAVVGLLCVGGGHERGACASGWGGVCVCGGGGVCEWGDAQGGLDAALPLEMQPLGGSGGCIPHGACARHHARRQQRCSTMRHRTRGGRVHPLLGMRQSLCITIITLVTLIHQSLASSKSAVMCLCSHAPGL